MGKKKVKSEEELKNMVLPAGSDVLGIAEKMLGFDRVLVKCQDGHERLCRIRGKMKRRKSVGKARRHRSRLALGLPI